MHAVCLNPVDGGLGQIGQQLHFAAAARHRVEHQPRRHRQHRHDHQAHRQHRGRQPRDEAFLEIGDDDRDREADRNQHQENADRREEPQRLFRPVKFQDGAENPKPVAPGVELADRAFRPRIIRRLDFGNRQRQFERVHAEFGFDLETIRQHRKGFDEAAREHAVAGKDILEGLAEHRREKAGQHPVAGAVAGPVGGDRLIDAKAHHHVEMVVDAGFRSCAARWRRHRSRRRRPAHRCRRRHRRTCAGPRGPCPGGARCAPGAGRARHLDGAVLRIVVVDEDLGRRQRLAKIGDDGRDRGFLVVARHQNRNPHRCWYVIAMPAESSLSMERSYRNQALAGCPKAGLRGRSPRRRASRTAGSRAKAWRSG